MAASSPTTPGTTQPTTAATVATATAATKWVTTTVECGSMVGGATENIGRNLITNA